MPPSLPLRSHGRQHVSFNFALFTFSPQTHVATPPIHPYHFNHQIRSKSTHRRHAKALRLPPASSFARTSSPYDHIIFNPPSSAPNVCHTPAKFLPPSDSRRKSYSMAAAAASANPSGTSPIARPSSMSVVSASPPLSSLASIAEERSLSRSQSALTDSGTESYQEIHDGKLLLPPSVRPVNEKKYHLTQAQVDEMRELRQSDPRMWSRSALAERYKCSNFFVGIMCKNFEAGKAHELELEAIKERWGPRKTKARNDRVRRRETWGREM